MKVRLLTLISLCATVTACGGGSSGTPQQQPPANRAPVASNQSVATDPGVTLNGTLQASDADGDTLTYAIGTGPASGSLTLSGAGNRDFEYVPNGGFVGQDSFTFTASDGQLSSAAATVTVNVNTRPTAQAAAYSTTDIVALSGTLSASDVEGDAVTFAISSQPGKGNLTSFDAGTGDFVYTPDPAEDGIDTFGFTANDGFQDSAAADITVEIFGWSGTQQFGSAADDFVTTGGLFFDSNGSLTFGGATDGQLAAVPAGDGDAYVRRVDRRGNPLWTVQYGDVRDNNARVIIQHPSGSGLYVISPGAVLNGEDTASVALFDDDGILQWNTPVDFQGDLPEVAAYWAGIDNAGDIYVLSWDDEPTASLSGLVTKVSGVDGSFIWEWRLRNSDADPVSPFLAGTGRIQPRSIDVDSSGNLILAGTFIDNSGGRPCFVCTFVTAFQPDGTPLWTTEVNDFGTACSAGANLAYRVTVGENDNLYMIGTVEAPGLNTAVVKYDSAANQALWTDCDDTGDNEAFSFTPALLTADGGVLVVTTVYAVDPATLNRVSADIVVKKLDSQGGEVFRTVVGAQRADGSDAFVLAGSIVEGPLGSIFISGSTDGELTAGANAGSSDVILLRLDADGNVRD